MMDHREQETLIGYSVFEKFEECYQLNENACFIADSQAGAQTFLKNGYADASDCRIDAVTFADIMLDFGFAGGQYAMESQAFKRFKAIAQLNAVSFTSEPCDGDETLRVVEVDGVKRRQDW